jgi:hypothetical protein
VARSDATPTNVFHFELVKTTLPSASVSHSMTGASCSDDAEIGVLDNQP